MNQVATQQKSVLMDMADRYSMEPTAFERTVRATCSPKGRDARDLTREEFAAFLLVSKEYGLNPLTKEIYAFPAKGGGIVPVLSIDGWVTLVNSHKQCNGFEFEMHHDDDGKLVSCTCHMYRKDRDRPVTITEYLAECKRGTEPWNMEHRMLRHKTMIQAARYAFGFSGIYDEEEGATIANMRDVTPAQPPKPPKPPQPPQQRDSGQEITDAEVVEGESAGEQEATEQAEDEQASDAQQGAQSDPGDGQQDVSAADEPLDVGEVLNALEEGLEGCKTTDDVDKVWTELRVDELQNDHPDDYGIALSLRNDWKPKK